MTFPNSKHFSNLFILPGTIIHAATNFFNFSLNGNDLSGETKTKATPINIKHEQLIDLGLSLEKLIVTTNNTTKGFIAACYAGSVSSCILIAFQLAAMVKANNFGNSDERRLVFCGYIFATIMYLTRLHFLMGSGQRLGTSVIQAKRALEEYTLTYEAKFMLSRQYTSKLSTLQKRLDVYQVIHPITPYSVFNLSRKTYYSTLGIILTYIVLLIKLRDVPQSKQSIDSTEHQLEHSIHQTTYEITE